MTNEIFDRETILDLVVNFIPLFIILFFTVGFLFFNPFGFESLASGIQFGLLIAPFVLLAILTYISGKAISGSEKNYTVYLPGQATVTGAEPLHELEEEETDPELEGGSYLETEGETGSGTDDE
jgi:hypothetical protein